MEPPLTPEGHPLPALPADLSARLEAVCAILRNTSDWAAVVERARTATRRNDLLEAETIAGERAVERGDWNLIYTAMVEAVQAADVEHQGLPIADAEQARSAAYCLGEVVFLDPRTDDAAFEALVEPFALSNPELAGPDPWREGFLDC